MAYIPKEHLKYDILPFARENNYEVFAYDSELLQKAEKATNNLVVIPYGFHSFEEYIALLDDALRKYPNAQIVNDYKQKMFLMNDKTQWGIVQYKGDSIPDGASFTKDRYYYVPMFNINGEWKIGGIIDDEEFTDYIYPLEDFIVIVDPSGTLKVKI